MASLQTVLGIAVRQAVGDGTDVPQPDNQPSCSDGNSYDGRIGLRISAIFVILVTSTFGTFFPVLAHRYPRMGIPSWAFFIAKYFGSGVIVATAFIHLLAPANKALSDPCLTGPITDYDWVEGIALMTIFSLFFVEILAMRYSTFGSQSAEPHSHAPAHPLRRRSSHIPGDDHLSHVRDHEDLEHRETREDGPIEEVKVQRVDPEYAAQITAMFILEFGVIFHSVFIGLTLAVAGEEFKTLYVVLVFHQTFEGLGLGSRLALTPWPKSKHWTPYIMAIAYGVSTPIAIAIGLGLRSSYPPGSQTTLIVNGVFDSISAGILIYTGLVELMAHEFLFSQSLREAPAKVMFAAFGTMVSGAGLMALLGKWA